MRIVVFAHSLVSCWNHGNAHFLRGVLRELVALGHAVTTWEPQDGWSRSMLLAEHPAAADDFAQAFPELSWRTYPAAFDPAEAVDGASIVMAHEWSDPALIGRLGRIRSGGASFTLLFHDTHHRAVSDPQAIRAFDLSGYDGVLAFGRTLADIYARWGWGERAFVWHEAADARLFRPSAEPGARAGLVWIGNWGDGERAEELREFLLEPARAVGLALDLHGVRYPDEALRKLGEYGAQYRGWLPNARAPEMFARHLATVHVPRRYYATALPGIPTIRVFEALACGIPLICAPWEDSEGLFNPGRDFLVARDGAEMRRRLRDVAEDPALRESLAASGIETIRSRHTCAHRARELLAIADGLAVPRRNRAAAPVQRGAA